MKISEMSTEAMANMLCRIAGPVERIGMDKAVSDAIVNISKDTDEQVTGIAKMSMMFGMIGPALLGAHLDDTVEIVAAMTGKSAQEVRAQSGMQTIADIREFFDEDFSDFFGSSAAQEQEA